MARRAAPRSGPARPLALVVMVVSLVLVGWAVRGLVQAPVPGTSDLGQPPVSVGSAADTPSAGPTETSAPRPTPPGIGRSSASLPALEARPVPVRLTVPTVGLEVVLEGVGVSADGQMEIPDEGDRAGWYRHGAAPGDDVGSIVVAAHVDTSEGPAEFLSLTGVSEGDQVEVELDDGSSATYRIVGGEQVAKRDLAVDELFRRDGEPVLRLVTCTGDWLPSAGSYTDNLVISAVPVEEEGTSRLGE